MNEAFISCVEQFYYHDEEKQEQAANFELKKFQKDHLARSLQELFKTMITIQVEVLVITWLFAIF